MNGNRINFLKNKTKSLYVCILSLMVLSSGFFLLSLTNIRYFRNETQPTSRFNNRINFVYRTNGLNVTMTNGLVLMSWDGVNRSVFLELLYNGYLPNINKLNIYNMDCNTEYNAWTVTAAQHSIMLSGYLRNVTGTLKNNPIKPLGTKSLFYRIKANKPEYFIAGLVTKIEFVAIPVLGVSSKIYKFSDSISGEIRNSDGFNYIKSSRIYFRSTLASIHKIQEPSKLYFNSLYASLQGIKVPTTFVDDEVLRIAEVRDKFLYFFHIADPDEVGHALGSHSDEYRQAIVDCDYLLGNLMERLPYGTVFIITSDHGFNGYRHENCPHTFLASNVILKDGYEVDIAPTIYDLLGVHQSFNPSLNGKSLRQNIYYPMITPYS